MIKVNGLSVSRIPINGKETLRIMQNGQQLWSGTGLPSGYKLLEYIESSGSQYIDTKFKPNQNTRVLLKFSSSKSMDSLYGAQEGWGTKSFSLGTNTFTYGSYADNSTLSLNDGNVHESDFNKGNLIVDGVTIKSFAAQTFQLSYNMFVFANNENNTIYYSNARIYSCKIYDNNILIRDYVPCMNPNGVCGLFDKVERKFYQSATSTPFTGV